MEVAATCAYLFVSVLTSSFLLAVYKAGSFSGAGLLLRKVVLKSVQKDLEESVAEACFHLWVPFGSVHMAWEQVGGGRVLGCDFQWDNC